MDRRAVAKQKSASFNFNFEQEQSTFSIEDLENDLELLSELKDLGWADEVSIADQRELLKLPPMDIGDKESADSYDVDYSDAMVEAAITDDSLMEEFNSIQATSALPGENESIHVHGKYVAVNEGSEVTAKVIIESSPIPVENSSSTIAARPVSEEMTAAGAKAMALKLKKIGKTEEALNWLKRAKMLEMRPSSSGKQLQPQQDDVGGGPSWSSPKLVSSARQQKSSNSIKLNIPIQPQLPHVSSAAGVQRVNAGSGAGACAASSSNNNHARATSSSRGDPFSLLENALLQASDRALQEAKRNKTEDPTRAVEYMKQYKRYKQDLDVLEARRNTPGATPALFHWKTSRHEEKVENVDIASDQLKIAIETATSLEGLLVGESSKSIILDFDLGGIPKDNPYTGKLTGSVVNGSVNFQFSSLISSAIRRSSKVGASVLASSFGRKKATFTLTLKRGMFYKDLVLATASLPFTDLLTKCVCGGELPLMRVSDGNTGSRSSSAAATAAVGGRLRVHLYVRTPVGAAEVRVTEERVLVVEDWPPVLLPPAASSCELPPIPLGPVKPSSPPQQLQISQSHQSTSNSGSSSNCSSGGISQRIPSLTEQEPSSSSPLVSANTAKVAAETVLSAPAVPERELKDPCSVDILVSNDVLEYELSLAQNQLQQLSSGKPHSTSGHSDLDEDRRFYLQLRVQLLSNKLALLVRSVQAESISMTEYLDLVRDRIARDKALFKALHIAAATAAPPEDEDEKAARLSVEKQILNRVRIMMTEIEGVIAADASA